MALRYRIAANGSLVNFRPRVSITNEVRQYRYVLRSMSLLQESIATSRDGNERLDQMAGAVRAMTDSSLRVKSLVDEVNLGARNRLGEWIRFRGRCCRWKK